MARRFVTLALLGVISSFNGCTCGGGEDTTVQTTKSCGEEMSDLQEALAKGAISQAEYDRMRKAVLDRCK